MDKLKNELDMLKKILIEKGWFPPEKEHLISQNVFPFNDYEFLFCFLLYYDIIDLEKYLNLRNEYYERNKYLFLYELAPRTFGETWGQDHILTIEKRLKRASKLFDPNFDNEYDLWYDGIKIEVKASRAALKQPGGNLVQKALPYNSSKPFDMNFQQLKPSLCDVFIWIAVWRDTIIYWVLSSNEVQNNAFYSKGQHRLSDGEGQLWIKDTNIKYFDVFLTSPENILETILQKSFKKGSKI